VQNASDQLFFNDFLAVAQAFQKKSLLPSASVCGFHDRNKEE
jgi:hypothetical protein